MPPQSNASSFFKPLEAPHYMLLGHPKPICILFCADEES
jgi:hypothetical protein